MRNLLNKKIAGKRGFTLMEMLIVVAIIAILVAIAIPTFTSALEKAREAADVANLRAAYAEAVVDQLTDGTAYGAYSTYNSEALVSKAGKGKETTVWTVTNGTLTIDFDGSYIDLDLTTDAVS